MEYIHGTHEEEQDRLFILNRLLNERCLAKIHLKGDERVLDIGSGLGVFTRMLAARLASGHIVGVERSGQQLEKALKLGSTEIAELPLEFREGSAYELPLKKEEWHQFDLVFIRFLLEHLADPLQALSQAKKAMRTGARIMLMDDDHANFRIVPHTPAFEILWDLYCKVYEAMGNDPFIGRNLVSLLHRSGFSNFKIDFILFGAAASEPDFMHYANNLIGILAGAKKQIMQIGNLPDPEFERLLDEIRKWAQKPDATLWYAANWVEASA